jgi:hypothetical protein
MRMIIDGISYNVESYRLRFRLTKKKLLIMVLTGVLIVTLSIGIAHADPSFWVTYGAGGHPARPV